MGEQFVLGRETIAEAIKRGKSMTAKGYLLLVRHARRGRDDGRKWMPLRYFKPPIENAIAALAKHSRRAPKTSASNPGISVKLSALHPRYEQCAEAPASCWRNIAPSGALPWRSLPKAARMGLNIDAEEADRLDLSLDVIEARAGGALELAGWNGFGVVVQAYGKRAVPSSLNGCMCWRRSSTASIMVRLVKGAYWDTESEARTDARRLSGLSPSSPARRTTDVSYICLRLENCSSMTDRIYPQFATHNAHTVAAVLAIADGSRCTFEFQRLHGMGEAIA
jgi:RHH-type transcriptional regulator, proline utilization regulon repressor / proline dehydrogenase / delta 1-pyrroline-5-carboxylate dehydrogenase